MLEFALSQSNMRDTKLNNRKSEMINFTLTKFKVDTYTGKGLIN